MPEPEVEVRGGTTPRRLPDRARYDEATVHGILDEALVAHLGFVVDGSPRVLPTLHVRVGDTLYLHGSTGSTPLLAASGGGLPVCVTVTLIDGLLLTRSAFNHSVAYRSVVAHGRATPVTDPEEKARVLAALVDHVVAGRSGDTRPPSRRELAATAVLALPLSSAAAKVRGGLIDGVAGDDPPDVALPHWAGLVPLRLVAGAPVASGDLGPVPVPSYLAGYHRGATEATAAARDASGVAPAGPPAPSLSWYERPVLGGTLVRLEPLGPGHIPDLYAASRDRTVFRWLSAPWPSDLDMLTALVTTALTARDRITWAQVDPVTGRAFGMTSFYDIDPANRGVAIGHTWLDSARWRTGVNTEAKLLLLGRAFDELGANRVAWHTDGNNGRSQAAIERLGASREGVLRQHRVRPDGSLRDTVCYGLTRPEWPDVRERLAARLVAA